MTIKNKNVVPSNSNNSGHNSPLLLEKQFRKMAKYAGSRHSGRH